MAELNLEENQDEDIAKLEDQLENLQLQERLIHVKFEQQQNTWKVEEDVLRERVGEKDASFDFTQYARLQEQLDLDVQSLVTKFNERKKGSLTEIQAKQQWEIKQLEQKMALTETNPEIMRQVNQLKNEVSQLTYLVDKELHLNEQLLQQEKVFRAEILKSRLERKQKAEELLLNFKKDSIRTTMRVTPKPRLMGNPISPLAKSTKQRPKIDCSNINYEHLHDDCKHKIRIYKEESRKLLNNVQQFMAKRQNVEKKMHEIVVKRGFKAARSGFLDTYQIENCLEIMLWLLDEGVIEDVVWLCLIEDVFYNLNATEVQQRIGLESQCSGLRKRYGVVYDK